MANWRIASTSRVRKTLRDFLKGGGEGGKVVIAGQASGDFSEFRPMYSLNSVHPLVAVAHLVSTTSGHSLFGPVSDLTASDEEALVAASLSSGRGPHDEFLLPGGRELSDGAVFSPHAISADWSRDMRESLAVLLGGQGQPQTQQRGDGNRGGRGRGSLIGEAVRRDRISAGNASNNNSNAVSASNTTNEAETRKSENGGGGGRSKKKGGKKNRGRGSNSNNNEGGGRRRQQALNVRGAAAPPASCVPIGAGGGGDGGGDGAEAVAGNNNDGSGNKNDEDGLRRSVLEAAGGDASVDYLGVHLPTNLRLRDENRALLAVRDRVDSVRFRPVYGHHVPTTAACAECRLSRGRLLLEDEQLTWRVGFLRDGEGGGGGGGGGGGEGLSDGDYVPRSPAATSFPLGDLKSMRLVVSGVPLSAVTYRADAAGGVGLGAAAGEGGEGDGRPPGRPLAIVFESDATLLGRVRCDALPDRALMSDAFRNVLHGVLYGPPAGANGGGGHGRGGGRGGHGAPGPVVLEVDEVRFDHANVRETLERLGGAGMDVSGGDGGDGGDPDAVAIEADLGDLERRVMALLAGPGAG